MSDLAISSSLLVASLDLAIVQSVTRAIRTADLTSAASARSGSAQAAVTSSPRQAATEAVQRTSYVRNCEKPPATFESCPVYHWHTRLNNLQPYTCARPVLATESKPTIQPPWRVLPWPKTDQACAPHIHRMIKIESNRADVTAVGQTLDLFV